ncbi:MAG: amino acid ABC transporter permease [Pleomorphochaeta sp.]
MKNNLNPFLSAEELKHPTLFWMRKNLFSSIGNSLLTLISVYLIYLLIVKGALPLFRLDWTVIKANMKLIFTGSYPVDQLWRVWILVLYIAVFFGFTFKVFSTKTPKLIFIISIILVIFCFLDFAVSTKIFLALSAICLTGSYFLGYLIDKRKLTLTIGIGWILLMPISFIIVRGFGAFLPIVKPNFWGGLLLSLLISLTSIFLSLPIGLLLALGRRSKMKFISIVCTIIIEVVRGVPLITILFIGYLILPMALPASWTPSVFIRALTGVVMFHSAYMAESFRGGLQGISVTQYEAAKSLNIGSGKTLFLIILPQVLKRMIPILVNAFTSALKDTSLISIIGMLDLIGISTSIVSNPKYLTGSAQVLFFEGLIYFILCYSISKGSMILEKRLKINTKVGL